MDGSSERTIIQRPLSLVLHQEGAEQRVLLLVISRMEPCFKVAPLCSLGSCSSPRPPREQRFTFLFVKLSTRPLAAPTCDLAPAERRDGSERGNCMRSCTFWWWNYSAAIPKQPPPPCPPMFGGALSPLNNRIRTSGVCTGTSRCDF